MVLAGVGVCVLFLFAWTAEDEATAHFFDCLHWTLAYLAAATVSWLGVRDATGVDRVARRWFAIGLTLTAVGDLLYDYYELTGRILLPQLNDLLFLSLGPCFVIGLAVILRKDRRLQLRTFLLDVFALALVLLTLTLDLYLPRVGSMATIDLGVLIVYPICLLTPVCVAIVMAPTMRMRPDPRRILVPDDLDVRPRGWSILLVPQQLQPAPPGDGAPAIFPDQVERHGEEPGPGIVRRGAHRSGERLLGQVLRPVPVAGPAVQHPDQGGVVLLEELGQIRRHVPLWLRPALTRKAPAGGSFPRQQSHHTEISPSGIMASVMEVLSRLSV